MERCFKKPAWLYLSVFITISALDIITKILAEIFLNNRVIDILPFLKLTLVYNKGIAFGFFSDLPDTVRKPLLVSFSIIGIIISFIYTIKTKKKVVALLMGSIGGGAFGNLYDRLFLGHVRDFIYLHYGPYHWPAFNIADASITLSVLILALHSLVYERRR